MIHTPSTIQTPSPLQCHTKTPTRWCDTATLWHVTRMTNTNLMWHDWLMRLTCQLFDAIDIDSWHQNWIDLAFLDVHWNLIFFFVGKGPFFYEWFFFLIQILIQSFLLLFVNKKEVRIFFFFFFHSFYFLRHTRKEFQWLFHIPMWENNGRCDRVTLKRIVPFLKLWLKVISKIRIDRGRIIIELWL